MSPLQCLFVTALRSGLARSSLFLAMICTTDRNVLIAAANQDKARAAQKSQQLTFTVSHVPRFHLFPDRTELSWEREELAGSQWFSGNLGPLWTSRIGHSHCFPRTQLNWLVQTDPGEPGFTSWTSWLPLVPCRTRFQGPDFTVWHYRGRYALSNKHIHTRTHTYGYSQA